MLRCWDRLFLPTPAYGHSTVQRIQSLVHAPSASRLVCTFWVCAFFSTSQRLVPGAKRSILEASLLQVLDLGAYIQVLMLKQIMTELFSVPI